VPPVPGNFAGTKGVLDHPFSVPGSMLGVRLRTCDASSFAAAPEQHVVTVALPGKNNKRTLLAVTAGQCPPQNVCNGSGVHKVECRQVPIGNGGLHFDNGKLLFPFPDSSRNLGNGPYVLSGATAIAVRLSPDVACDLGASPCAAIPGLIACVDSLYEFEGDTICGTVPHGTFKQFTALPPPNVFAKECWSHAPPCTPTSGSRHEVALAVEPSGDLLIPFAWEGISPTQPGLKRLVRGFVRDFTGTVALPSREFISSYSPEGGILFPFLDVGAAHPVAIEGSVDSPSFTVLRIARTVGRCDNDDSFCPGHCAGGTCRLVCPDGSECPSGGCSSGKCGQLFDLDPKREDGIGPVVFRRPSHMLICRQGHGVCKSIGACGSGDRCEGYALEADAQPTALVPIVTTPAMAVFVVGESSGGKDLNGDGDVDDEVVVVHAAPPGGPLALGGTIKQCPLAARAPGRAVVLADRQGPPAIAGEESVLAFLESEQGQGRCDEDGDGSSTGAILRTFVVEHGRADERTAAANLPADPAPVLDGRSVVVSRGLVFYRDPDSVLRVFDPRRPGGAGNPRPLGPASRVAVANGVAGFIGPDPAGGGSVRIWREGDEVTALMAGPATDVALSSSWIAAIVQTERGTRLAVRPIQGERAREVEVEQAADTVSISGALIAIVTPEQKQQRDLNGDGDRSDRVLELYHADAGRLVNVEQQVEDFVLDGRLVAFRTSERGQDGDLNGDGDRDDVVLQLYDAADDTLINTREAAIPCPPPACDPQQPYRISATQVRFLAPTGGDPLVKVFDVSARRASTVASLAVDHASRSSNPLQDTNGSLLFPSRAGRCVVDASPLPKRASCPEGTFGDPTLKACALATPSVCLRDTDCPGGAHCAPTVVAVAVAMRDTDGDGIPDGVDARPSAPEPVEAPLSDEKASKLSRWLRRLWSPMSD
jgi:hypothetical protein